MDAGGDDDDTGAYVCDCGAGAFFLISLGFYAGSVSEGKRNNAPLDEGGGGKGGGVEGCGGAGGEPMATGGTESGLCGKEAVGHSVLVSYLLMSGAARALTVFQWALDEWASK